MNRLFGRAQGPRRNSDDEHHEKQYWTPRGVIPAKAVDAQLREVAGDLRATQDNRYPKIYNNEERTGPTIQQYERRDPGGRLLYEVPINSRMDLSRPGAAFRRVEERENGVHHNDRARVVRNELNDPGPLRGIVTVDRGTGQNYGLAGVIYHPEGNPRGFERARVEPIDRQGRQYMRRFEDDSATNRVSTWPPRDEDAEDLVTYETRYGQVRRPRNRPQPGRR